MTAPSVSTRGTSAAVKLFSRVLVGGGTEQGNLLRLLGILLVVVVVGAALSGGILLRPENLSNILQQNAVLLVVVTAQFLVIVTGGFDLSVGAAVALASVVFVSSLDHGVVLAILAALASGLVFGIVNGVLVTLVRLPSFVVTLGTMQIGYSLAKMVTGGGTLDVASGGTPIPQALLSFYSTSLIGLPLPVWVSFIILIVVALYLRSSTGCFVFAIGGNNRAARLAGIPVARVRLVSYAVASITASIAGLLFSLRVGYGDPQAGVMLPLDSIAAVSIGGVSLTGGRGSILAGFIGVLIIAILGNVMNLLGVAVSLQPVVEGVIVILTVFAYGLRRVQ
jgi:ribose transport system permease protein